MYGFLKKFDGSIEKAHDAVVEAPGREGFGVLTEIDVKATLKMKLDVDRRPYMILGACNPQLARQAIDDEPDIGLLLPCNVSLREEEDRSVTVGPLDPAAMVSLSGREDLQGFAEDVRSRLLRVRDAL
ncbi:MAG: DUF302 domain-containing protein [Proteobacteria bacterium]|nr:MAG: DUF302 domain-containing protein [Pseudomonadota bacterium]